MLILSGVFLRTKVFTRCMCQENQLSVKSMIFHDLQSHTIQISNELRRSCRIRISWGRVNKPYHHYLSLPSSQPPHLSLSSSQPPHLSLSSLQRPPSVTIIIATTTICHHHHHNHHHLSLSSPQPPPSVTIIITTTIFYHFGSVWRLSVLFVPLLLRSYWLSHYIALIDGFFMF